MLDKTTKPPCLFKLTWNAKHGLPLMKERKEKKKKKAVHLIYQIRQESKILSMLLLLRRPKQEAINWRQRKWLQVSKPGKIPSFSPPPGTSLGGSCPSAPSHTQLNAIRTSNFQIHTMKGVGKEDCKCVAQDGGMQKRRNQMKKEESTRQLQRAGPTPRAEERGVPSTCPPAVCCLLLYRRLWEAGAVWIHLETSYLQDP